MTNESKNRFVVIDNKEYTKSESKQPTINSEYHSNPIYQKLLQFRNLQEQQKKKFSVDDLFKLC